MIFSDIEINLEFYSFPRAYKKKNIIVKAFKSFYFNISISLNLGFIFTIFCVFKD